GEGWGGGGGGGEGGWVGGGDEGGGGGGGGGAVQAGPGEAAQEVQGGGVHSDQGGRGPAHAVLQQLSSAVLLPHHGRDRSGDAAGGDGDDHAGGQCGDGRGADHADCDGGEAAVCHPRGRQNRRRRRRGVDHRVTENRRTSGG